MKRNSNIKREKKDKDLSHEGSPEKNVEESLRRLASASQIEALNIDFDRGVWILQINRICATQFFSLSEKIRNANIKHVAIEFIK